MTETWKIMKRDNTDIYTIKAQWINMMINATEKKGEAFIWEATMTGCPTHLQNEAEMYTGDREM